MTGLLRFVLILLGSLPLWLLHALGTGIGMLLWWLPNNMKRMTRLHLRLCLPETSEAERDRLARRCLTEAAKALVETPAIWFGPAWRLRRWLRDDAAAAQLKTLIAGQRGLILLSPHIGSWELTGLFCAANSAITSLYKPQKGAWDTLSLEGRCRNGAALVPTSGAGVKSLLQSLRRGEMIGILPDHDPPDGAGVFAPFFGIPAHTTALVSKLAARSGAPVWFIYAERLSWGRGFRIHLSPAAAAVADPVTGVATLNLGVENVIRHLSEQYWWGYKRYRRLPPDTPDPYRDL